MANYKNYIGKWWSLTGFDTILFVIKIKPRGNGSYYDAFVVNENGDVATLTWDIHWMEEKMKYISSSYHHSRKAIINIFKKNYNG